jgi:NAD(P)-dependent dehydrogenase (short-subunit alcohol dehydrogenase family)
VAAALEGAGHEVVRAGHSDGDVTVDLASPASVDAMYAEVGALDAVVCAAGIAVFGALEDLDDAAFRTSLDNKLMGQVELVRRGLGVVREGGSFTLTSGTLSRRPTPASVAVAMAGAALEGFAKAVALDLRGRWRVNVVSPGWVAESRVKSGLEPMPGIWAEDLAAYYLRLVEGNETGAVLEAEGPL